MIYLVDSDSLHSIIAATRLLRAISVERGRETWLLPLHYTPLHLYNFSNKFIKIEPSICYYCNKYLCVETHMDRDLSLLWKGFCVREWCYDEMLHLFLSKRISDKVQMETSHYNVYFQCNRFIFSKSDWLHGAYLSRH